MWHILKFKETKLCGLKSSNFKTTLILWKVEFVRQVFKFLHDCLACIFVNFCGILTFFLFGVQIWFKNGIFWQKISCISDSWIICYKRSKYVWKLKL